MNNQAPLFLPRTINDYYMDAVDLFADNPAIDFYGKKFKYHELDLMVTKIAIALQKKGVVKGERVGLCLPNCPYYTIFYFAILKCGAIVVNFNPLYVTREMEFQVNDSGVKLMITLDLKKVNSAVYALKKQGIIKQIIVCPMGPMLPINKRLLLNTLGFNQITRYKKISNQMMFDELLKLSEKYDFRPVKIVPDDMALLQYTGGTTGRPKGVILTHANISANMEQIKLRLHDIKIGAEKSLCVVPFFHVLGMTGVQNLSVMVGAEMIMVPKFEIKPLIKTIRRARPTVAAGVPTIFTAINNFRKIKKKDLSSIRYAISGGAPLPVEVKQAFEKLSGGTLVEGYGLSESSPLVSVNPVETGGKPGSIGTAVEWTHVEFRDLENPDKTVAQGEKGELCVSGPQVMQGYWNNEKETKKVLEDGKLLRTGDVGYIDEDGYIFLVDRIKDLILCSGYNVYPREIEDALYECSDVEEAIVIGVPDQYRGQAPKAFVKLKHGHMISKDQLKGFLSSRISKIKMPREIEFRDELPKTMVGKLSKKELIEEENAVSTAQ